MRVRETSCDIFISKQFVCEVKRTENCSCILIFALFLENIGPNCLNVPLFLRLRLRDICKRSCSWFARDSPSKHYLTDQPFMSKTWWCTKNSCLETQMLRDVKADTNRKCPIYSLKQMHGPGKIAFHVDGAWQDYKLLLQGMIQTKHP